MKAEKNLEYIACPTCGVDNTKSLFGVREIVCCRRCGLVYINPRRSKNETASFYERQYIPDEQMLQQQYGQWRRETLHREAKLVKGMRQPGRILDVGCAGGEFLKYFLADGWECSGVEPSKVASEEARQLGIHIYNCTLQDAALPERYFDVISIIDMLPLDPAPLGDLLKARHALKDDGLMVIELPGLPYRIARNYGPLSLVINRRWSNFSPASLHLFYFSTSSLRRLLEKAGFRIVKIVPEMAPLQKSAVLQSLNRLHFWFSKLLFGLTSGKVNLAAKVVYLCTKLPAGSDNGS